MTRSTVSMLKGRPSSAIAIPPISNQAPRIRIIVSLRPRRVCSARAGLLRRTRGHLPAGTRSRGPTSKWGLLSPQKKDERCFLAAGYLIGGASVTGVRLSSSSRRGGAIDVLLVAACALDLRRLVVEHGHDDVILHRLAGRTPGLDVATHFEVHLVIFLPQRGRRQPASTGAGGAGQPACMRNGCPGREMISASRAVSSASSASIVRPLRSLSRALTRSWARSR